MLSKPQLEFVRGIVAGLEQTAAYRKAYPKSSPKAAESSASALIRLPKVAAEIARHRATTEKKAELSREDLQRWLERVISANPSEASEDSDICETSLTKAGPFTTLVSKLTALDRLARMRGLYQAEKVELSGEAKITVRIGQ